MELYKIILSSDLTGLNNKLSVASDHLSTCFVKTLTYETGTLTQVPTTETGPCLVPH